MFEIHHLTTKLTCRYGAQQNSGQVERLLKTSVPSTIILPIPEEQASFLLATALRCNPGTKSH